MSKRGICQFVGLVLLVVFLSGGAVSAASPGCFTSMAQCFEGSVMIESFWYRTWEALDCELGFISCVRIAVFGL